MKRNKLSTNLLYAPTRSGMSGGVVFVPDLLNCSHSIFAFDVNPDDWVMTDEFKTKQICHDCLSGKQHEKK